MSAAAATGLTFLAAPASAVDRGANGLVVFSEGSGTIATLNTATSAEKVLTPSGQSQANPAVSPDGGRIAYAMNFHIYIETITGTKAKAVAVTGNPYEGFPAWSPDATRLAYANGSDGQIYTVPARGGTSTQLTTGLSGVADLHWSPDGTRIAFDAASSGRQQLFAVRVGGTHAVTQLTTANCTSEQPDFSPDGTQLALSTTCVGDGSPQIAIMPAAGGSMTPVAYFKTYAGAAYPSWSPDGTTLIFSANEGQGSSQLWSSPVTNTGGDGSTITATRETKDPNQPSNTAPSWQPVHHSTVAASPTSGAQGATVRLTGRDFLGEQTIKLTLVDESGVSRALGTVRTSLTGGFTATITVPSSAALGTGKLVATGVGGLKASRSFTVS